MKQKLPVILLSLLISLFIAACSSIPKDVDEKYLAEKSESDTKAIYSLEQKIIDKNKEKQAVDKKLKEQSKLPSATEEEIKLLKKENGLLKDQVYYYEKNIDAVNLENRKAQLAENELKMSRKTAQFEYQKSENRLLETELELRNAELAQHIAELNVEKSKIAAMYRDKNEPVKPEKEEGFFTRLINKMTGKDPDDKYGYKKYNEHLDKKKHETLKAETKYREEEKKFKAAGLVLDKVK